MVDLSEVFSDETGLRGNLVKKRQKEIDRLGKITEKAAPIKANIEMYDKMIAAIDERKSDPENGNIEEGSVSGTDFAKDETENPSL